ncbi:hypothetical protein [Roseicyclus sp.]|uniref:hypothetical protein n=1 Tax=Roseicyclus sp. TaxID=1914329 RepID=UPI001BCB55AF|nr:hypothetical protein [Roseicyclus sp.]
MDNATYRALVPGTESCCTGLRNGWRALAAGFTTLRVMGHRDSGDVELAAFIRRGLLPGPRLSVAPWVISPTAGAAICSIPTPGRASRSTWLMASTNAAVRGAHPSEAGWRFHQVHGECGPVIGWRQGALAELHG